LSFVGVIFAPPQPHPAGPPAGPAKRHGYRLPDPAANRENAEKKRRGRRA